MGDAEVVEILQALDGGVEGAALRKGADVELVDDGSGEGRALPEMVVPVECFVVVDGGRAVDALRLVESARGWVVLGIVAEEKRVFGAGAGVFDGGVPVALVVGALHGVGGVADFNGYLFGFGCPKEKFMHW